MAISRSGDSGGKSVARVAQKTPVQNATVPKTAVVEPINRGNYTVGPAPVALGSGGGGGGGGGAVAATAAAARPSLDDYIKSNFLYTSALNEGQRQEDDFDAESLRLQQETEAEMGVRQQQLARSQADASMDNAEDFASRGLGRSGLVFQKQDEINARGAEQQNDIAGLLTQLLSGRQQGRQQLQATNRNGLNEKINQLTSQFNSGQVV